MNKLGLIVTFEIPGESREEFLQALYVNAEASLNEPGCRQFDVLQEGDNPGKVVLYEIYDDPAALKAHIAAEHTQRFLATTKRLHAVQTVQRLTRIFIPTKTTST